VFAEDLLMLFILRYV